MTDEVPELPEWVKTLIETAREEGYYRGREDGMRWQWECDKSALERTNPL